LLLELRAELGMTLMLISHDLGLARSCADEVIVMYAGQIVEQASTPQLFTQVRMPYTEALFEAIPRLERPAHSPLPVIGCRPPAPSRLAPGRGLPPGPPPRRGPRGRGPPGARRARTWPPLGVLASLRERGPELMDNPLLEVRDLVQEFVVRDYGGVRGGVVHA